jgi:thioesterase domain-containing protein
LYEARTIRKLSHIIREATTQTHPRRVSTRALVPIQPKGTQPPLFVISGIGGNVLPFWNLPKYLGEDQPVYGLIPRGLEGDGPYQTNVEEIAAYYIEAIRERQALGPYRLLGFSFGGTIAFEMAQQLVAAGASIGLLGMLDTIERRYREHVWKSLALRDRIAAYRSELKAARLEGRPFRPLWIRLKTSSTRIVSVITRAMRGQDSWVGETLEAVQEHASANYRPTVFPGTVTLFRCTEKGVVDGDDDLLGWGQLTTEGVEVHHVPSNHVNILQEPAVRVLASKLRECLVLQR